MYGCGYPVAFASVGHVLCRPYNATGSVNATGALRWVEIIPLEPDQCPDLRREAPSAADS